MIEPRPRYVGDLLMGDCENIGDLLRVREYELPRERFHLPSKREDYQERIKSNGDES